MWFPPTPILYVELKDFFKKKSVWQPKTLSDKLKIKARESFNILFQLHYGERPNSRVRCSWGRMLKRTKNVFIDMFKNERETRKSIPANKRQQQQTDSTKKSERVWWQILSKDIHFYEQQLTSSDAWNGTLGCTLVCPEYCVCVCVWCFLSENQECGFIISQMCHFIMFHMVVSVIHGKQLHTY